MHLIEETPEQRHNRFLKVLAFAELKVFKEPYLYDEFPLEKFPDQVNPEALALVRDEYTWSQLIPSNDSSENTFKIFRFHFKDGLDNSGFVSWLANHLKQKIGTGVIVTCGQNSYKGGIFDYWGCPVEFAKQVIDEIKNLRNKGKIVE